MLGLLLADLAEAWAGTPTFSSDVAEAASRAACACAVTFAPPRPRVLTSRPTRNARSCTSSAFAGCEPRTARREAAGARSRVFLGCDLRNPETPYPSVPEALAAEAVAGAAEDAAPVADAAFPSEECAACTLCGVVRPITTVEMACLKINCSCPLASRTTEYLSKERIRPVSFTPLSR